MNGFRGRSLNKKKIERWACTKICYWFLLSSFSLSLLFQESAQNLLLLFLIYHSAASGTNTTKEKRAWIVGIANAARVMVLLEGRKKIPRALPNALKSRAMRKITKSSRAAWQGMHLNALRRAMPLRILPHDPMANA